jgi:hypothetical protein
VGIMLTRQSARHTGLLWTTLGVCGPFWPVPKQAESHGPEWPVPKQAESQLHLA